MSKRWVDLISVRANLLLLDQQSSLVSTGNWDQSVGTTKLNAKRYIQMGAC